MNALVSYHAIKLGEYMCKPPFCRLVYINMTWLIRPSMSVYNAAADSSVGAATDDAVVPAVRLSWPGLRRHTGPHLFA